MNIKIKSIASIIITLLVVVACKKGPKVITTSTDTESTSKSSGVFDGESPTPSDANATGTLSNDIHTVVVKEILPATKYNYLKVNISMIKCLMICFAVCRAIQIICIHYFR